MEYHAIESSKAAPPPPPPDSAVGRHGKCWPLISVYSVLVSVEIVTKLSVWTCMKNISGVVHVEPQRVRCHLIAPHVYYTRVEVDVIRWAGRHVGRGRARPKPSPSPHTLDVPTQPLYLRRGSLYRSPWASLLGAWVLRVSWGGGGGFMVELETGFVAQAQTSWDWVNNLTLPISRSISSLSSKSRLKLHLETQLKV